MRGHALLHATYLNLIALVCFSKGGLGDVTIKAGPGPYFLDENGRVLLLRGVNVAGDGRLPPFTPIQDLRTLNVFQVWGVNVVRMVFLWEAYEPTRGNYNSTYLDYVDGVVKYLHELGIKSIIEMHQDGFSRWLNSGCGSGFPKWTINPVLLTYPPTWFPNFAGKCPSPFDLSHGIDISSNAAWINFMDNWNGVKDAFLDMWSRVSEHFAQIPGVIGYDMLNEPATDGPALSALYEDVASRIRSHHKDAILFVSASLFTWQGGPIELLQPKFDNYALSVHYYNQNDSFVQGVFRKFVAKADAWNVPLFVGEFAFAAVLDKFINVLMVGQLATSFYNAFDRHFLGWTQWAWTANYHELRADGYSGSDYSITDEFHNHRANYIIRPYPRAIAGKPMKFVVDDEAKTMELVWEVSEEALKLNMTTDIFAPVQRFFQQPAYEWLNVTVAGPADMTCQYSYADLIVSCRPDRTGVFSFKAGRAYDTV